MRVGDGINDSPALSEADVGIAVSDGAAIAQEIADITIAADSLGELVKLRRLAEFLMARIRGNYCFVMGFNGALIALGVAGVIQPSVSAALHNLSTLGISLHLSLIHISCGLFADRYFFMIQPVYFIPDNILEFPSNTAPARKWEPKIFAEVSTSCTSW